MQLKKRGELMNNVIPVIKLIEAMNEQPIAFNKHYVFLGCGINGALMLSQLVYWTSRTKNKDGWIYKTHEEWTLETGLTRREQDTARKILKTLGFLVEKKAGVPCKLHFRVERENLYKALIKYSESLDSSQLHKSAKLDAHNSQTECTNPPDCMHKSAKLDAQIRPTNTENTYREYTEITTESDLVENSDIPKNQNPSPEQNSVEHTLKIWSPNLDSLNSWLQRSGLPKITKTQADEILLEINPHYEKKIAAGVVGDTQMYSNFVKWVKRDHRLVEKLFEQASAQSQQYPPHENPTQPVFKGVVKKFKGMSDV